LPAKGSGRTTVSIYRETFELFESFYREHEKELRALGIGSPSELIIRAALRGFEEFKRELRAH
jgi:hypothetical protein